MLSISMLSSWQTKKCCICLHGCGALTWMCLTWLLKLGKPYFAPSVFPAHMDKHTDRRLTVVDILFCIYLSIGEASSFKHGYCSFSVEDNVHLLFKLTQLRWLFQLINYHASTRCFLSLCCCVDFMLQHLLWLSNILSILLPFPILCHLCE